MYHFLMKLSDAQKVEQDWHELKSAKEGFPRDIWETISAFANAEGGKIFLGITPNGDPVNLSNDQMDQYQGDVLGLCRSEFFNETIWPEITVLEDASVVCVEIRPLSVNKKPLYKKSMGLPMGAFVRIGSSNTRCDDEQLRRFMSAASGGAENGVIHGLSIEDLEEEKIQAYRNAVESSKPEALSQIDNDRMLRNIGAVDDSGTVTLLGLLCFGNPELITRHTPQCKVVFTQYRGTRKVDPRTGKVLQLDDREFTGNIIEQYTGIMEHLHLRLPVGAHISGNARLRQDELAIPVDALREVVANALAHRDYSNRSSPVLIEMYDDRIEFNNPGTSLVPLAQIETHQPASRNPQLMMILRDWGVAEQRGRGIPTILVAMENADLDRPKFEHRGNSFAAILSSANFLTPEILAWLDSLPNSSDLNVRQKHFLAYLKGNSNPWKGNKGYREINHMGTNQSLASREIRKLAESSLLETNGKRRRAKMYRLSRELA